MRALTIRQPYASLIMAGIKTVETRSWSTNERGPLAIHAALRPEQDVNELWRLLEDAGVDIGVAFGCVIGVVDIIDVLPTRQHRPARQRPLGDFRRGRYAWLLANPRELASPIPVRGQQSLWPISARIERRLHALD